MPDIDERIRVFEPFWDKWRIRDSIGEGSFGKVYTVVSEDFGKVHEAALKHVSIPKDKQALETDENNGNFSNDTQARSYYEGRKQTLANEILTMYQLQGHSHIVNYQAYLIVDKTDMPGYDVFIRMEKLKPLPKWAREKGGLDRDDIIKIGRDIADALKRVHQENILHRDIKPENVFYGKGEYKLGDFGVARTLGHTAKVTAAGTPNYMAPEVYRYDAVNNTADIYSLGIMLYRLLNGNRAPFLPADNNILITQEQNETALARRMKGDPLPPLSNVDDQLMQVILKACAFHPGDRYQSAEEMIYALEACGNKHWYEPPVSRSDATVIVPMEDPSKRAEEDIQAKAEAEAKAKARAEAKARAKAEAEARAKEKAEAQAKAKAEAEAKAKAAAEAKAKAKAEAEAKAKEKAEQKAKEKAAKQQEKQRNAERKAQHPPAPSSDLWAVDPWTPSKEEDADKYWGLSPQPTPTPSNAPIIPEPRRKRKTNWLLPAIIAGGVVLAVLVLVLILSGSSGSKPSPQDPGVQTAADPSATTTAPSSKPTAVPVTSFADYTAATAGTSVRVEAFVQAKSPWKDGRCLIYVQNEKGGYLIKDLPCTQGEYNELKVGTKLLVDGVKQVSQGESTIGQASYEVLSGYYIAAAKDVTAQLGADLSGSVHQYVTVQEVAVTQVQGSTLTLSRNGNTLTCMLDRDLSSVKQSAAEMIAALEMGSTVNVKGFLRWNNGPELHITEVQQIRPAACQHQMVWRTQTAATCSQPGTEAELCVHCGAIGQTRPLPATGVHTMVWQTTAATCTTDGIRTEKCSGCGMVNGTEPIGKLGHDYQDKIERAATCGVAGSLRKTCSRCRDSYTVSLPVTGEHKLEWRTTQTATCTESGLQVEVCTVCNGAFRSQEIEKLGHSMQETERLRATCTTTGLIEHSCTHNCGYVYTVSTPATGHHYGEWQYYSRTEDRRTCTCGHYETRSVPSR